ncbi:MAG: hypothetical protein R2695_03435 [Acidimicrobiales bacterium]
MRWPAISRTRRWASSAPCWTYPDGTIQHDGIVIDDARPLHPFRGSARRGHVAVRRRCGGDVAVTGGCLMARRADLLGLGGFSVAFPLSFNDVDLCVRMRRAGWRVVVEPAAHLVHHETSRSPHIDAAEWDRWIARWGAMEDPWYHPGYRRPDDPRALHRNADHLDPGPALRPGLDRIRSPWLSSTVHRRLPEP